eukprot:TRINITY_DN1051_c0_g1_i6.p2 TRINITY_DN1051_c0_g1~~TRINITY_DN1051_c0_g1_i6.p2  ORF type:complete len:117 (-),score=56.30 TRINITY_DN1051_c0_g1_i6:60-410(-)
MKEHVLITIFFFSSRRRHTRCSGVSWARRCVQETAPINDALKRIDEKRYAAKRSFTGQDITGEDGVFSTTLFRYSKSKEELENAIKLILIKRQINAEARNYVQRIEREVREKCNTL